MQSGKKRIIFFPVRLSPVTTGGILPFVLLFGILWFVFGGTPLSAATLSLTTASNTITITIDSRYEAVITTNDTTDYLVFKDKVQNNGSPPTMHEFKGPCVVETSTTYCLRDDGNRQTSILEVSTSRVRIRVRGKFNDEAGTTYLEDTGSDDDAWVMEEFTFTTDGVSVVTTTNFKDGVALDLGEATAGDTSLAYDLILTNQTASTVESYGPLTIVAGESFENNNLTFKTYGTGDIVLDQGGDVIFQTGATRLATFTNTGDDFIIGDDGTNTAANIGGTGLLAYGAICTDDSLDTADDCIDAARTAGTVYGITSSFTIDDIAENFPTMEESIEQGEIVALDYRPIPAERELFDGEGYAYEYETEFVKKAGVADQVKLVGVASGKPGVLLGGWGQANDPRATGEVPVSLAGRVPVSVSLAAGDIKAGDTQP